MNRPPSLLILCTLVAAAALPLHADTPIKNATITGNTTLAGNVTVVTNATITFPANTTLNASAATVVLPAAYSVFGNFSNLGDVPGNYSGAASRYVRVNSGATALEFVAPVSANSTWVDGLRDQPPATANATDDEFNGTVLDAKWAWINQGNATANLTDNHLVLSLVTGNASFNQRIITQNITAANFTITSKQQLSGQFGNYTNGGIVMRNSTSGNIVILGRDRGTFPSQSVTLIKITSPTTYLSSPGFLVVDLAGPLYMRVVVLAGSMTCQVAEGPGAPWTTYHNEATSAFIGTPDQVGLAVGASANATWTPSLSVDWFRFTSP